MSYGKQFNGIEIRGRLDPHISLMVPDSTDLTPRICSECLRPIYGAYIIDSRGGVRKFRHAEACDFGLSLEKVEDSTTTKLVYKCIDIGCALYRVQVKIEDFTDRQCARWRTIMTRMHLRRTDDEKSHL